MLLSQPVTYHVHKLKLFAPPDCHGEPAQGVQSNVKADGFTRMRRLRCP